MEIVDLRGNKKEKKRIKKKPLYEHQVKAIEELNNHFKLLRRKNGVQRGMLVMPTGSGKTFTAVSWLLEIGFQKGFKIFWLSHKKNLISQAYNEFLRKTVDLVDIKKKEISLIEIHSNASSFSQAKNCDINVCSIQTLYSQIRFLEEALGEKGKSKLIVVIDEAHRGVSKSYDKVLSEMERINPKMILLGLTATPTRVDFIEKRKLEKRFNILPINKEGNKKRFIYEVSMKELFIKGLLAIPKYRRIETKVRADVQFKFDEEENEYLKRNDELSPKVKEKVAKSVQRNKVIVEEYVKNKDKYGKTLIFAVNQMHAKTLAEEFKKKGVACDYCISDRKKDSQEIIENFKNNKFKVLINVEMLTEGSDIPDIQTIFLARKTNSEVLLVQMIGRGLRGVTAGGTKDVYIVDFNDIWQSFVEWIDLTKITIGESGGRTVDLGEAYKLKDNGKIKSKEAVNDRVKEDLMNFYNRMKFNIEIDGFSEIIPLGWFNVESEENGEEKILVYDNEVSDYKKIEENLKEIIKENYCLFCLKKKILNGQWKINEKNLEYILKFIKHNKRLPKYYSFKERENIDCRYIAAELKAFNLKKSEINLKLNYDYNENPKIREFYHSLEQFKEMVWGVLKQKKEIEKYIKTLDLRKEFMIENNYYNLINLSKEIEKEFALSVGKEIIESITWSKRPMKSYFGKCIKLGDKKYKIIINKLLSSKNISEEATKYVLYHELLHANKYMNHGKKFREEERKFPMSSKLDMELDSLINRYNLDKHFPKKNS